MALQACFCYDAFISFRNTDTRDSFTKHLYNALRDRRINNIFIDDEELQRREEITPSLAKEIQVSNITKLVLSAYYASSSFCLDELAKIIECSKANGRLVLPVFNKVDPSHLRRYGEAMTKHEERLKDGTEKVKKWREALRRAANSSGYRFTGCGRGQENADPGAQNQGEEKPQVLLDASEYLRISVAEYDPRSFDDVVGWSLNAVRSALACQVRVIPRFRSDREDMDFRRTGDHRQDSKLLKGRDLLKHAQNYSPSLQTETNLWKKLNILPSENQFSLENEESSVAVGIDLEMEAKKLDGKMTSEKLDYSSDCNLSKHKETMPKDHRFQPRDTLNQQKCKETTKRASAFVILAVVCIWFLLQTWSETPRKYSVPTLIHVQPLYKDRGPVSIGVPLIGLFGFMACVWAAAMMILVGAQFTRLHSAVFIFWAILMHVRASTYQYSEYFS